MENRKDKLIQVFEDTVEYIRENPTLSALADESRSETEFYPEDCYPGLPKECNKAGAVTVTKSKSFEAAMRIRASNADWRIAVLNFASATNPGGGVKHGSSAQEESLCRCSTLYSALNSRKLWDSYYSPNRAARNPLYNDALIYSPGVVICKTDAQYPQRMSEKEWVTVDVLSCAAPNLRTVPGNRYNPEQGEKVTVDNDTLYQIHNRRARHILTVAASKDVDALILGAFGCGAFRNDPSVVAKAYRDVLGEYRRFFSLIEFAIYCRPFETANYDAFQRSLNRMSVNFAAGDSSDGGRIV